MTKKEALFRKLPGVDRLLMEPIIEEAISKYTRNLVLKAVHQELEELRKMIQQGEIGDEASWLNIEYLSKRVIERAALMWRPSLGPLINATGVVIHTNLGRSILGKRVVKRLDLISGAYNNLEYDLDQGIRGSRYSHVANILKELTSAEDAMVVNNNAAAVLVSLETLAKGREVVVSRGQLVEIGGSFRIPEVMRKSGAKMVEVGTTNKTHLKDYEEVIGPETALLLKVHTSNFQVVGFTEQVSVSELAILGKRYGIPVMEDLGSGCLVDLSCYGLTKEPTVMEALSEGADLVTFSGDKLLGGPQAGVILGRKDLVGAIKENQLCRALRVDKLTLLALEETLRLYRDEEVAAREIPTLRMIFQPYSAMLRKVKRLRRLIGRLDTKNFSLEMMDGNSRTGGGSLPLLELPSRLLCMIPQTLSAQFMENWLRSYDPPVIARLEKEKVLLDVRTIQEGGLKITAQAIKDLASLDVNQIKH